MIFTKNDIFVEKYFSFYMLFFVIVQTVFLPRKSQDLIVTKHRKTMSFSQKVEL